MIFLWILLGIFGLLGLFMLWQWWRDEQEKNGKILRASPAHSEKVIPSVSSAAVPLHPSIDPYLAELRVALLQEPLPQGPGQMMERVWTFNNEWMNLHANDVPIDELFDYHEVPSNKPALEPEARFTDISHNTGVPSLAYLHGIEDRANGR